jgi:hypothetical protein
VHEARWELWKAYLTLKRTGQLAKRPTVAELRDYADEIGFKTFDADKFHSHYEGNGWMVGRVPMKDWKATVRYWRTREHEYVQRRQPVAPMAKRNEKINELNRQKARLMRMKQTPQVKQELEMIRIQLHDL